jgi:Ca2+-binding RTX toxin-like protein
MTYRPLVAVLLALPLVAAAPAAASTTKHRVKAKLSHRTLVVAGNGQPNKITLRLRRNHAGTLQVDAGSNGSADFSFDRRRFDKIVASGGGGNDIVTIDEFHGAFTRTERTTLKGGQGASDRLVVNGSDGSDSVGLTRAGQALRLTKNGAVTTAGGFELVDLNTHRGADGVAIGDLTGTGVRHVNAALGSNDGQPDAVTIAGTPGNDALGVSGNANVTGLAANVSITQAEPAHDSLLIDALGGDDSVDATGLTAPAIPVALDGGDGTDSLALRGSNASDSFDLARSGGSGLNAARDAAPAIATAGIERLGLDAAGGADRVAIGDLTGTGLTQLTLALGAGDGQTDAVTARATDGADTLAATSGANGAVSLTGFPTAVDIVQTEPGDSLTLDGGAGADTIDATGLAAGTASLTIKGGPDADTITGSPGDDTIRSAPGDGVDTVEGKGGIDTLAMDGSSADETFAATPNGARLKLTRGPDGGSVDAAGAERVQLNGLGGADTSTIDPLTGTDVTETTVDMGVSGAGDGQLDNTIVNGTANPDAAKVAGSGGSANVTGLGPLVSIVHAEPANDGLTINTLAGADSIDASSLGADSLTLTMNGGDQADTLVGSAGVDVVDGGRDNDVASLGAGDDTFRWDPGDGSDTIDGQGGTDRLLFNDSNANENIDLSPNGTRALVHRDVGNVTQDMNGVERVDVNAVGGADTVAVNDLTGTDVTHANLDLGPGDGAADTVVVNGTANPDNVTIGGDATGVILSGGSPNVSIAHSEPSLDRLNVNGLAGADMIDASGLAAGAIGLTLNGGDQADTLTGSAGPDVIVGGRDADTALLGPGDDTFVWNPGDQSDTVEGQGGTDTLQFNGADVGENMTLSANGARARFTRDVANITMDLAGVEHVNIAALGGADTITVGDMSGTDVTQANIDLGTQQGGGDGAADNVIVLGTANADAVSIGGATGSASLNGLPAVTSIVRAEAANDRLTVDGLGGDDILDASTLPADAIGLTMSGGMGADVVLGGAGNDILHGDEGDDVLIGGPGADTLDGGTGSNVLIQ